MWVKQKINYWLNENLSSITRLKNLASLKIVQCQRLKHPKAQTGNINPQTSETLSLRSQKAAFSMFPEHEIQNKLNLSSKQQDTSSSNISENLRGKVHHFKLENTHNVG